MAQPSEELNNCMIMLNIIKTKMEAGEIIQAHSLAQTLFGRISTVRDDVIKLETYRELKGKLVDENI